MNNKTIIVPTDSFQLASLTILGGGIQRTSHCVFHT